MRALADALQHIGWTQSSNLSLDVQWAGMTMKLPEKPTTRCSASSTWAVTFRDVRPIPKRDILPITLIERDFVWPGPSTHPARR